ncbi:hypothetical protein [Nocardia sp. NPDC005366]|uniref:hypothetical protein n=1 Tax=Nocardia sp. NPDC005366 TaxID=3156878 RepID=UPI0033A34536
MELRVGLALASAVDATNVIVTKVVAGDYDLTCGGVAMTPKGAPAAQVVGDPDAMRGSLLGKRYVTEGGTLELLVTKAGEGSLAVGGQLLQQAGAKALPASD